MCLPFRNYAHDCHYLDLHPIVDLTDEQFYQLCRQIQISKLNAMLKENNYATNEETQVGVMLI